MCVTAGLWVWHDVFVVVGLARQMCLSAKMSDCIWPQVRWCQSANPFYKATDVSNYYIIISDVCGKEEYEDNNSTAGQMLPCVCTIWKLVSYCARMENILTKSFFLTNELLFHEKISKVQRYKNELIEKIQLEGMTHTAVCKLSSRT